jgi:hypothetical protein
VRGEAGKVPVMRDASRRNQKLKQYLLSVYRPDDLEFEPGVLEAFVRNLDILIQEMKAADAWVFTAGLQPAHTATVVQLKDDEVLTTDGPFVEDKWHLSGLMIVKAPDTASAIEWARKLANLAKVTKLPVEVRELRFE